jgi:hypothetical protein
MKSADTFSFSPKFGLRIDTRKLESEIFPGGLSGEIHAATSP